MKLSITLLAVLASANAFSTAPSAFSRGISASITTSRSAESRLFADPKDDDEEGLDLNLEEMFEMFDAADADEDFDDAVKKVKGE